MKVIQSLSILGVLLFSVSSSAYLEGETLPVCLDGKTQKTVNNREALDWKTTTRNGHLARSYVKGKVVGEVWTKGEHARFIISIGSGPKDILEIIYNENFGKMPNVREGDTVTVCGDFINAFAKNGRYDASPAGAIVHWVHYNPGNRTKNHEHGFIMFEESTLVGFDDAPRGAWSGRIVPGTTPEGDRDSGQPSTRRQNEPTRPRTTQPRRSGVSSEEEELPEICRHVSGRCN